MPDKLNMAI